jgi:hypothetical protein
MISLKVMKCRNNIIWGLTMILTMIILTGSGVAASAAERIFSDVPDNHWAERYIARMSMMGVVEGYEDGTYGLSRPVSRFEIIASIIRVMGLEDEAEGKSIPASFRYPASVPTWAQKYVAMGVIQGIISGDDLVSFRGGEPAKRFEVAEFVGKAIELSVATEQKIIDVLPYVDAEDIPARARGYVSLLRDNGIMEGSEDGFRPLANVTRGEMAALLAKLDEKINKLPDKAVRGTVSQVTQSTVTVKTPEGYETLIVDDDCLIFLKDGKGALSDLTPPSDEVLVVKEGFRAKLIDVNSGITTVSPIQKLSGKAYGNMVSINYYPQLEIIISTSDGGRQTIPISDDCIIEREKEEVLLKDILPGDKVEITIEDGKGAEILAVLTEGNTEGKIKEIIIRDKALLTVIGKNEEEHSFEITSNTKIRKDGTTVSLLDLKAGDYVDVEWESSFATKVYAESRPLREQVTGKVTQVNTDLSMLFISREGAIEDGDHEQTVVFASGGTRIVTLDGTVSTRLSRVKTGDKVVVVGDWGEGFIEAQTIIILGAAE